MFEANEAEVKENRVITRRRRRSHFDPIDELAISGPDAELVDVVDGRRFWYYFEQVEQEGRPLPEVVQDGLARFHKRYKQAPTVVILSASYGLDSGQFLGDLEIVAVDNLPWYHFWFGPKPDFYQLTLDFEQLA